MATSFACHFQRRIGGGWRGSHGYSRGEAAAHQGWGLHTDDIGSAVGEDLLAPRDCSKGLNILGGADAYLREVEAVPKNNYGKALKTKLRQWLS